MNSDPGDLEYAIALIRNGDRHEARGILKDILKNDPGNEQAWIWLIDSMSTLDDRKKTIELWLKVSPEHPTALKVRQIIDKQYEKSQNLPDESKTHFRERPIPIRSKSQKKQEKHQQENRRKILIIAGVIVTSIILVFILVNQFVIKPLNRIECSCIETEAYMQRVVERLEDWKSNQTLFMFLGSVGDVPASSDYAIELYQSEETEIVPECLVSVHTLILELLDNHLKFAQSLEQAEMEQAEYYLLMQNLKQEELQAEILRVGLEVECK